VTPDGRLKILDFGLAKLVRPVSETAATMSLTDGVAGTVPYMAPEQLREEPLDGRTDLHAAGAVLYEMATGQRPYRAEQQAALIDSILNQEPESLRKVNPSVSVELETVILKALEKAPTDRYQSAGELGDDLRRWSEGAGVLARPRRRRRRWPLVAVGTLTILALALGLNLGGLRDAVFGTGTAEASIAVLPSVNVGGDPAGEYLAEAITDDLILRFSGVGGFEKVINTTTMLQYKGTDKTLDEIADKLGVSAILSSRVRHVEDRIQLTAQLIEPRTGEVLWGGEYEHHEKDMHTLYANVVGEVISSLNLSLSESEKAFVEDRSEVNPEAYRAFKLGRMAYLAGAVGEAALRAVQNLETAVAIDSTYTEAWIELSRAYGVLTNPYHWQGKIPFEEILEKREEYGRKGEEAAQKVLALDPEGIHPFFHVADGETPQGKMKILLEKHPGDASLHYRYAWGLVAEGRHEEAVREHERAIELDPGSPRYLQTFGWQLMDAGELDQAAEHIGEMLVISPGDPDVHYQNMWLNIYRGNHNAARAALRKALELQGIDPTPFIPVLEAIAGTHPVDDRIHGILEGVEGAFGPGIVAQMYAAMGEYDYAVDAIERCVAMPFSRLDAHRYVFRPLRSDPRFVELVGRFEADE
jgi:TolB-like protein